ncbi:protein-glutamate methylesterase/protein-glutamine glutaminase [Clostridium aminobutyricum]|uniref:Protein-glutamate methylesterase/protein-glutamine glutaminase n=1 Tax=Clostridium aminobutyricum TaxID=33953 RepID=A0A939D9T0_CLOAM|nr:chemotaxis response regulator protein-glutamate methylesterase [Clostridium aminobutyricum]MBN7773735.1 chemotaxis response regulator protein-glutamate methylesterase [Clostridium aminobutyricum]
MGIQGKNIRVLICDDSPVFRTFINAYLSKKEGIEIIGIARDAFDAQDKIQQLKPDVLSLDVEMPRMNGIELTKKLMTTSALPIILVSAADLSVFDALQAGAVDIVKKPDANITSPEAFIDELASKIRIAAIAKVSKSAPIRSAAPGAAVPPKPAAPIIGAKYSESVASSAIIAIGASTGGTEATLAVLQQLPAQVPPILVVQHMPAGFTKLYAERLNKICAMNVKEAQDGDSVMPGTVYIAPGDYQMELIRWAGGHKLRCTGKEKVSGHCPSVDVLFSSVAKESMKKNIGIILTGMGKDGATGLLEMRKKGAYTIGESQESCVVYGMPMVAQNIGAVMVQASNREIAHLLMKYLSNLS